MPESPPSPDDKLIFELLCQMGLGPPDAYTFVQEMQNMAAANLIARFEAKLDAQNAKLDAQNAQLVALRWVIGIGLAGIGILLAVFRLLG